MLDTLHFQVRCACRRWTWRELAAATAPGLILHERKCPRCDRWMLIVFRVERVPSPAAQLVGVVRMLGRDVLAFRRSVAALGISAAETEALLEFARLMAQAS